MLSLALTIVGIIIITAFNLIIDPYGIFNLVARNGININKPANATHARLFKAAELRRKRPTTICIGSSRVDYGISPETLKFYTNDVSAYNASISSASIYEILRYVQHAWAVNNELKNVVVGLDFFAFDINDTVQNDFDESYLALTYQGRVQYTWWGWLKHFISYDCLEKSLYTIKGQNPV